MRNIGADLRFALRVLAKSAGFATVAVVTLALGIAASTTVFSWIDTVILRPLPGVANPNELAALEGVGPAGGRLGQLPQPDFRDFQREMTQVSGVIASHAAFFTIGPPEHPQRVLGQVVSANFFAVLGVQPFLGRMLTPAEDRDTQGAYPYAVISHRLWTRYFNGDAGVVGRKQRINGRDYTIIGVAARDFVGTFSGAALDVWVPLSMILDTGTLNTWAAADRNARFLDVIVRLKPGVTIEQAQSEVRAVAARTAAAYPDTHQGVSARLLPMSEVAYGVQSALRNPLCILMAVCVLVLVIGCANVANLLMARSVSRQKEFGVRLALGAGRARLMTQLLFEVLLLAGGGALLGALAARRMTASLFYVLPALDSPVRSAIEPLLHPRGSGTALLFAMAIALGAALLATLMPGLYAGRVDVNETLKEGARGGTPGAKSHRARGALVIAEVALATLALIGASLAVRTFQRFEKIDLGFERRNALVAQFHLSKSGYSLKQEKQFCRNLRLRLEAVPAIEEVAYADSVPLSIYGSPAERVQGFGPAVDDRGVVTVSRTVVAPGYFQLMRIPLLAGRDFTEQDDTTTERVIIVNQTLAQTYFGERESVGRRVRVSGVWARVIGVVKNSKYRTPPEGPTPFFYGSFGQMFYRGHNNFFYMRARDVDAARAAFIRETAVLDPNRGIYDLGTLAEYTQAGLFGQRVAASLLSALGILAVVLAAAGLYSVVSYAVSERRQEISIRMALGAEPRQVLALVLKKGIALTLSGLAAGILGALICARALSSALESPVNVAEPEVFAGAAAALVAIAVLASCIPAYRATKIDPIMALRSE